MFRLYYKGFIVTSIVAVPIISYDVYEPMNQSTIRDLTKIQCRTLTKMLRDDNPFETDTCAGKICNSIFTVCITYPYERVSSSSTALRNVNYVGTVAYSLPLGVAAGLVWPVSVPLGTLYVAEQKFGYKMC